VGSLDADAEHNAVRYSERRRRRSAQGRLIPNDGRRDDAHAKRIAHQLGEEVFRQELAI
jgi:hypothetical protein